MPYFAEYTYNLTCSMFYNFLCDIDNLQEPSTTDIMLSRIEREIPKFVQVRLKYRGKFFPFLDSSWPGQEIREIMEKSSMSSIPFPREESSSSV